MAKASDSSGIADNVDVVVLGSEDAADLRAVLGRDPNAKGPVEVYEQKLADGSTRYVDRAGNVVYEYGEAVVQHEEYPGQYGGPVLDGDPPPAGRKVDTDSEGDPE